MIVPLINEYINEKKYYIRITIFLIDIKNKTLQDDTKKKASPKWTFDVSYTCSYYGKTIKKIL